MKRIFSEKLRSQKAITLVALVITIIILLILAGVVVNSLLGENGLIERAKEAKTVYKREKLKENVLLILMDYEVERETTGKTLQEFLTNKNVEYEEEGDNVIIEEDGYVVIINAITLEMSEPVKTTRITKISLNKNIVEPGDSLEVTLTLGEDVDITKCKYELQKTTEQVNVTKQVENTTINITAPNEKTDYYFYLLVGYKNSEETQLKKVRVKVDVEVQSVTLNKQNTNLFIGETDNLTANVLPIEKVEQDVTWSTSDSSIATVDQTGKVTAIKGGTAQITATSNKDITKKAICTVNVEILSSIEITTLPTKIDYNTGDSLDLTGMVVIATYESGNTKNVTSLVEVSPMTLMTRGTEQIVVSYIENSIIKNANMNVNVVYVPTSITPIEATASHEISGHEISKTYDNNNNTYWATYNSGSMTQTLIYVFDKAYSFEEIKINVGGVTNRYLLL